MLSDMLIACWNWLKDPINMTWLAGAVAVITAIGGGFVWIKRIVFPKPLSAPVNEESRAFINTLLQRISAKDQALGKAGEQKHVLIQENTELKAQIALLREQGIETVVQAQQSPRQTRAANQAVQALQLGDIDKAQALLFELEQQAANQAMPHNAQAAQLALEQGALWSGRNVQKAYEAFERAYHYDTKALPVLGNLIDLAQRSQGLPTAMRWAEIALDLSERLAASDPSNSDWQRDLSVSFNKVAGILEAQGERGQALGEYRKSLAIRERLAASDPSNSDWQRDLSVSYEKVAGILEAQGERGQALGEYRKLLAIRERLAASDPSNAQWQTDLVVSLMRISMLVSKVQGKQMLQQALSTVKPQRTKPAYSSAAAMDRYYSATIGGLDSKICLSLLMLQDHFQHKVRPNIRQ